MATYSRYTAEELAVLKSRFMSKETGTHNVRWVDVLIGSSWVRIPDHHIEDIAYEAGYDSITRCNVAIISPDGVKYDWQLDSTWYGILNTQRRKIRVYEGYGQFVHLKYTGYIDEASKDYNATNIKVIEIVTYDKLKELEYVDSNGMTLPEGMSMEDKIGAAFDNTGISDGSAFEDGTGLGYNSEPYEPPAYEEVNPKWNVLMNLNSTVLYNTTRNFYTYNGSTGYYFERNQISRSTIGYITGTNYIAINSYPHTGDDKPKYQLGGPSNELLLFDTNTGVVKPVTSATHKEFYMVTHPTLPQVALFGTYEKKGDNTTNSTKPYLDGVRVFDLDKNTETYFINDNTLLGNNPSKTEDFFPVSSCWGADGNIYYITWTGEVFKGEMDYVKRKVEFIRIGEFTGFDGRVEAGVESTSVLMKDDGANVGINMRFKGVLELLYLESIDGSVTYNIKKFDDEMNETETINISGSSPYAFNNSFDFGYHVLDVGSRGSVTGYTSINPVAGTSEHITIDGAPSDVLLAGNRDKNVIYLIPTFKAEGSTVNRTIYFHRLNESLPDPNEDAPELNYNLPTDIPMLPVLEDMVDNTGMNIRTDTLEDGSEVIFLEYPTIKASPDYIFSGDTDLYGVKSKLALDKIGTCKVIYGYGSKSGSIQVGPGHNKITLRKPFLNEQEARTLANRIVHRAFGTEVEAEVKLNPKIKIGDTIQLKANDFEDGSFIGVLVKISGSNNNNGNFGTIKLLG